MIITVAYGKIVDMDAARRCQRCDNGREQFGKLAGRPCPRCEGTGIHAEGWAYHADDALGVAVGDLVECPATPYTGGLTTYGTVVDTGARMPANGQPLKSIIRRLSTGDREVTT